MSQGKVNLLPNLITAFGLFCGLFIIFKMNMIVPGEVTPQVLQLVAGIMVLAAVADVLDGAVARSMKMESDFGGWFDSLADVITFGVSPSVIVLKTLSVPVGSEPSFWMTTAAMVYTVCGVMRLVRFNMTQEEAQEVVTFNLLRKSFTGLPIPAAAACIVSLDLFLLSSGVGLKEQVWIHFFTMILIGYLMISRIQFPSVKTLQIRVASFQMLFASILVAVLIFWGLLHNFPLMFVIASWSYVLIAFVFAFAKRFY
ncbi:MAG: CDP-alcohol phosphatidyltransferase family protein [Chlamydiia bacterium]|nr:CDP-alcohol phosphatidyltransferase family protein [Chlamydiia bacterium]